MERIDFHGSFFSVPPKTGEKKKTSPAKTALRFSDFFEPRAEEETETRSAKLSGPACANETEIGKALDAVHILGDKLKQKPTEEAVGEYREAVARFLHLVVSASYEVEEIITSRARDNTQKKDVLIRVVNEKLERLAVQIIKSQKNELEILRRVDEIYGLLIDLRQ